jgi:hypothetical protein
MILKIVMSKKVIAVTYGKKLKNEYQNLKLKNKY